MIVQLTLPPRSWMPVLKRKILQTNSILWHLSRNDSQIKDSDSATPQLWRGSICRSEGRDGRVSYLNWVWTALNGWSLVAVIEWDPTPCSKSTQLGSLYKKACMDVSSSKKSRVEASSDQSCFNIHHSQCLPLWLYNQTPLPLLAQSYQKTACLPSFVCHIHRTIQYTVFWSGFWPQAWCKGLPWLAHIYSFFLITEYSLILSVQWTTFCFPPSSDGHFDGSCSGYWELCWSMSLHSKQIEQRNRCLCVNYFPNWLQFHVFTVTFSVSPFSTSSVNTWHWQDVLYPFFEFQKERNNMILEPRTTGALERLTGMNFLG